MLLKSVQETVPDTHEMWAGTELDGHQGVFEALEVSGTADTVTAMNNLRERLVATLTEPSPHAEVEIATGWQAVRLSYAAAIRQYRKAGWRRPVTILGTIVFLAMVIMAVDVSVLRWVAGAGILGTLCVAGVAVLGHRGAEAAKPVRMVTLGEDRETVQVRFRPDWLEVTGWAYLDERRPIGCRPRPVALRVLDFADVENLPVSASVARTAPKLRKLYHEYGFVDMPPDRIRWSARLPTVPKFRIIHLARRARQLDS